MKLNRKGETLTETMVSTLIVALSITMVLTMIMTASHLTQKSQELLLGYFVQRNILEEKQDIEDVVMQMTITDGGKYVGAYTTYINVKTVMLDGKPLISTFEERAEP